MEGFFNNKGSFPGFILFIYLFTLFMFGTILAVTNKNQPTN